MLVLVSFDLCRRSIPLLAPLRKLHHGFKLVRLQMRLEIFDIPKFCIRILRTANHTLEHRFPIPDTCACKHMLLRNHGSLLLASQDCFSKFAVAQLEVAMFTDQEI
jgi:hypothetical protein